MSLISISQAINLPWDKWWEEPIRITSVLLLLSLEKLLDNHFEIVLYVGLTDSIEEAKSWDVQDV